MFCLSFRLSNAEPSSFFLLFAALRSVYSYDVQRPQSLNLWFAPKKKKNAGGGIPASLRNHRNFRRFVFAVPENGAPIPPWSKRSLAPALLLGYLDLFTDLGAVLSYHRWRTGGSDDLFPWFATGLAFIVGPALIAGLYVLWQQEAPASWWRAAAAAAQLGLVVEALVSVKEESYSHVLVALRVLEPLFQALPQLLLQAYVLLVDHGFLGLRVFSLVVSTLSLATASTAIVAEHPLSQLR